MAPPDPSHLVHLLRLLDDDSRMVRDSVLGKLDEFGPGLTRELRRLVEPPGEQELAQLDGWLAEYRERLQRFRLEEPVGTVIGRALFRDGDLVRHRRYGYRGVVVGHSLTFQASDSWYRRNRSQPEREQPWYHVLVHRSDAVTYAAQNSLLPDESGEQVEHTLVSQFFERFADGHYIRNGLPWPEGG